jgi:hypothetical protein
VDSVTSSEEVKTIVDFQLNSLKLALALVFYITNIADYYTTKRGLEVGLREANPFAKRIMKWGWRKYQFFKLAGPATMVATGLMSDDPNYVWSTVFAVGAGFFVYAAIQNMLLIAGRKIAKA